MSCLGFRPICNNGSSVRVAISLDCNCDLTFRAGGDISFPTNLYQRLKGMIRLLYFLALVARRQALAAPANSSQLDSTQNPTDTSLSSQFTLYSDPSTVAPITPTLSVASASLSSPTGSSSQLTQSDDSSSTAPVTSPPFLISSSLSPSSASFTSPPTSTIFVTEVVTAFETTTVRATPPSITIVTVVVTATATATVTTTPSPSWDNRTLWAAPPQMTDLFAFNVTYFPSGQRNLHIVTQIPAQAIAPTAKFLQSPLSSSPNTTTTTPSTILQLVYPAHSVNPGSKPEGGADFYASPLNLAGARNVTLEYSVFFPADFDWVKGGKLPGLFGGHTGCSGGASARDCFSTRLMWRPQGVGELYLVCTPRLVLFFRTESDGSRPFVSTPPRTNNPRPCARTSGPFAMPPMVSPSAEAPFISPPATGRTSRKTSFSTRQDKTTAFSRCTSMDDRRSIARTCFTETSLSRPRRTSRLRGRPSPLRPLRYVWLQSLWMRMEAFHSLQSFLVSSLGIVRSPMIESRHADPPSSTFFGGHGKEYATPKQQYTWFKDFAITRHD